MTDRIDQLTDKERDCLRLVWEQYNTKQIAEKLKINFHAVDGRIKSAVRRLDATDRFEAARMLARAEAPADIRLSISDVSDVPATAALRPSMLPLEADEHQAEQLSIEEAQAPYRLTRTDDERWFPSLLPVSGRERNDLKPMAKLFQVAVVAIGTALLFRVLADGLQALSH